MTQSSAKKLLINLLKKKRFADGKRKSVLVVGSGLHHHIKSLIGPPDWNEMIRRIRTRVNASACENSSDLTTAWETVLSHEASRQKRGERKNTSKLEERLIREELLPMIREWCDSSTVIKEISKNLFTKHRDIVTLNFDRTIDRAISPTRGVIYPTHNGRMGPTKRPILHVRVARQRIWHPHGIADPKNMATSIQLGLHGYAQSVQSVNERVILFRERQRKWLTSQNLGSPKKWTEEMFESWESEVRCLTTKGPRSTLSDYDASWVDMCILSDLIFVGCGLQRAEIDLWTFLHARQRQLAGVAEEKRPKVFYLFSESSLTEDTKYIRDFRPADITPVAFKAFPDIWEFLLHQE